MKKWKTNDTGKPPRGKRDQRVMVKLRNGMLPQKSWPVEGGRPGTRWTLTDDPFDIVEFRIEGAD